MHPTIPTGITKYNKTQVSSWVGKNCWPDRGSASVDFLLCQWSKVWSTGSKTNNSYGLDRQSCFPRGRHNRRPARDSFRRREQQIIEHRWATTVSGVTILLSLTVFLNLVAETLPQVSDAIPLLGTTEFLHKMQMCHGKSTYYRFTATPIK